MADSVGLLLSTSLHTCPPPRHVDLGPRSGGLRRDSRGPQGAVLFGILDADFGELPFHALTRVNKGEEKGQGVEAPALPTLNSLGPKR